MHSSHLASCPLIGSVRKLALTQDSHEMQLILHKIAGIITVLPKCTYITLTTQFHNFHTHSFQLSVQIHPFIFLLLCGTLLLIFKSFYIQTFIHNTLAWNLLFYFFVGIQRAQYMDKQQEDVGNRKSDQDG